MTCIVAIQDDSSGRVYMGGDSALSTWSYTSNLAEQKVFIKGEMLFGFCGSLRFGQLLRYALDIPDHDPRKSDMEYLVVDFIDALRSLLNDKGSLIKDKEDGLEWLPHSDFLLGYKGKLYFIDSDLQVAHIDSDFMCTGSGYEYALGCMYYVNDVEALNPEEKILEALAAASKFCPSVGGGTYVLSYPNDDEESDDEES